MEDIKILLQKRANEDDFVNEILYSLLEDSDIREWLYNGMELTKYKLRKITRVVILKLSERV